MFCLVVQHAGFVAAADALGTSPAYVSKRIKLLERALGAQLLHRTTRHVVPTEAGMRVRRWAAGLLDEAAQLIEDLSSSGESPRGLVRISSSLGFGRTHVAPLLSALCERYPGLEIRFDVFDKLVDLAEAGIDLDIRIGNDIAPHLIARRLASNARVLCAAPAYLAARGAPDSLEALAAHECLVIKERDHPFGIWRLEGPDGVRNVKVRGALSSNHGEIVHGWALDGRGIMLRSLWDASVSLKAGRLVRVLPDYRQSADIWAVYPSRLSGSAKLRVCVEFLEEQLGSPISLRTHHDR